MRESGPVENRPSFSANCTPTELRTRSTAYSGRSLLCPAHTTTPSKNSRENTRNPPRRASVSRTLWPRGVRIARSLWIANSSRRIPTSGPAPSRTVNASSATRFRDSQGGSSSASKTASTKKSGSEFEYPRECAGNTMPPHCISSVSHGPTASAIIAAIAGAAFNS